MLFLKKIVFVLLTIGLFIACGKSQNTSNNTQNNQTVFAKGADIGWLSEMESKGVMFYNNNNEPQECIALLKSKGINALRFRVWVNPKTGWCGASDVVNMAKRAKAAGMRIMIDFHYSDSWADPGQQTKPAEWANMNMTDLTQALSNHTKYVLQLLQSNGISPEWVQVGNETNDGMLWEEGRASTNMKNFAQLIQAGYSAVKSVDKNIKVIVHLSNGYDGAMYHWLFDGLVANNTSWDVIGMSLYPNVSNWSTTTAQCLTNMNNLVKRYNKPIIISEIGMPYDSPEICRSFIKDIIAKNQSLGNMGLGVFYWEPQCYNKWNGYTLGAFDNTGKPTTALNGFTD